MNSLKIIPEKYSQLVDEIIVHESGPFDGTQCQKFLPNPNVALVYHYGNKIKFSADHINFRTLPKMYVVHPYLASRYVLFNVCDNIRTVIFIFQPTKFARLFGTNTNAKAEIVIEATDALPAHLYAKLHDAFYPMREINESISNVLQLLNTQPMLNQYKIDILQTGISEIKKNMGMISIASLSDKCYVSKRSLERYFKTILMTTPDQYAKVVRFEFILKSLINSRFGSKDACAAAFGLTDYSHLIKEFKNFAGETPNEYLQNLQQNYCFEKKFHNL